MWWWYAIPLFAGIVIKTIMPGLANGELLTTVAGMGAFLVLALLLAELTRDRSHKFQSTIDLIATIREGVPRQQNAFA